MRRTSWLPLVVALALMTGCGGSSGDEPSSEGPIEVAVGTLPIEGLEPLYIAINEGYFEEEGLEVVPQQSQGGATIIPGIVSGDLQFGFSNNVSLLTASAQGLPLRVLANGTDGPTEGEEDTYGFSLVVADGESEIRDAADLQGKTVAVNTLQNIGPVLINASLERRGIDPTTIQYVEVPFPDMVPALESGDVDAVWLVEPFSTTATDQGAETLLQPYREAMAGRSIATWFTSEAYAQQNPEVVEAFRRALERGIEFTAENPQVARETLLTYTEISPEIAERMTLSVFTTELNLDDFRYLADLMDRYELIDEEPDVAALLGEAR